jgi:hypothetical protein
VLKLHWNVLQLTKNGLNAKGYTEYWHHMFAFSILAITGIIAATASAMMTMSVDIWMTNDSNQIDEEDVQANLIQFIIHTKYRKNLVV